VKQFITGKPDNAHPAPAHHRFQLVPPSDEGTCLSTIHPERLPCLASR
jgi:hypothetical protein